MIQPLRSKANATIHQLIERVALVPEDAKLKIELHGELATLLKLRMEPKKEHPQAKALLVRSPRIEAIINRIERKL